MTTPMPYTPADPAGPYGRDPVTGQPLYQPPPHWQQPYSYAPPQRSINGLAIASLVLGILGFLFVPFVLSLIFGFIALSQIKDGHQGGRGMAITGLVLSGIWLFVYSLMFIVGFVQGASGQ